MWPIISSPKIFNSHTGKRGSGASPRLRTQNALFTAKAPLLRRFQETAASESFFTIFLVQSDRIEIRGFGRFDCRHRPPRIARNPKTGTADN
ncbi:MAG: hypothetical protein HOP23_14225 [Methylococcaceae bacterium]|nr:hypothetical protein [Methylococcaceae bacterium]